jgi:hypothetical protein
MLPVILPFSLLVALVVLALADPVAASWSSVRDLQTRAGAIPALGPHPTSPAWFFGAEVMRNGAG